MYLAGALLYLAVCGAVAWLVARLIVNKVGSRWPVAIVLFPVLFAAPFADEIVGAYQFERLCAEAAEVKIYGAVAAGDDLYTPEGKWRIGLQEGDIEQRIAEWRRAERALERYVRYQLGPTTSVDASTAIPIQMFEARVRDATTGRVLAEWRQYGTRGGWLSQMVETPFIVRSQCMPDVVRQSRLDQMIVKHVGIKKGAR